MVLLDAAFFPLYDAGMHEIDLLVEQPLAGRSIKQVALGVLKVSYGQLKRAKFSGAILVDGCPRHTDYLLKEGERLRLCFVQAAGWLPLPSGEALDVAWEDEDILLINKPAPLPSVASRQGGETLENRVFSYFNRPEDFVYRPVNRLDKGTSGLMMVAKNAHIQQRMQQLLHTDRFIREYLALVDGLLPWESGLIDRPIGHGEGIKRVIDTAGRPALTHYHRLGQGAGRSLLELRLQTGRTHQIRVHLASLGFPVTGDFLYGQEHERLPGRFALHSHRLRFCHPLSNQWVECESPFPKELQELVDNPS